jgi:hypothetical protein
MEMIGVGALLFAKFGPARVVTGLSALCCDPSQGFLLRLEAGHDDTILKVAAEDFGHVGFPVVGLADRVLGFCHSEMS